jgi:hypothetical protein
MVDPTNVPPNLHHLIPLAEHFGISDDSERLRSVCCASPAELQQLRQTVLDHDELLDAWLAGPESSGPTFSNEYILFSAMRMAADYAV